MGANPEASDACPRPVTASFSKPSATSYVAPVTGGAPTVLLSEVSGGWGIAVDATGIFFGGFDFEGGFVVRLTRSATCAP